MRFIFGIGSKLLIWDTTVAKVKMAVRGADDEEEEEFEEAPPVDPHGTLSAHTELSPHAIFDGATARRFGFGSEKLGS